MNDWNVAVTVGVTLIAIGITMMRSHVLVWRRQKKDSSLGDRDQQHYYHRYRRRMQTSGCIVLLGILIPFGDSPFMWQRGPHASTIFWCAVLLLTVWIILLALGDLITTRIHGKLAIARVRRKQRELEAELVRIKNRRSNGQSRSD